MSPAEADGRRPEDESRPPRDAGDDAAEARTAVLPAGAPPPTVPPVSGDAPTAIDLSEAEDLVHPSDRSLRDLPPPTGPALEGLPPPEDT